MATATLQAEAALMARYDAAASVPDADARDAALDVEGNAVKEAMADLQRLLAPTPLLDAEVSSREADAAEVLRGARAYKSPYHDAHHATLVASSATLRRALGDGGPGTGFAYGAEALVRDVMHMISGAAKDALERDQGELPRLFDIAVKLRKDRDEARAAARRLVLAQSRERRGLGFAERQRMRDLVTRARDEARREAEEDKARLMDQFNAQTEELELLHKQVVDAREGPALRLEQVTSQLDAERANRWRDQRDAEARDATREAEADAFRAKVATLENELASARRGVSEASDRGAEALALAEARAVRWEKAAERARLGVANAARRHLRRRAFQLWRVAAGRDAEIRRTKAEAAVTLRAVRKGYEVEIEKTQRACEEKIARAAEDKDSAERRSSAASGRSRALDDATNQTRKGGARRGGDDRANRGGDRGGDRGGGYRVPPAPHQPAVRDPWAFMASVRREEEKYRGAERGGALPVRSSADQRAFEAAALEASERRLERVDAYYARAAREGTEERPYDDRWFEEDGGESRRKGTAAVAVAANATLAGRRGPVAPAPAAKTAGDPALVAGGHAEARGRRVTSADGSGGGGRGSGGEGGGGGGEERRRPSAFFVAEQGSARGARGGLAGPPTEGRGARVAREEPRGAGAGEPRRGEDVGGVARGGVGVQRRFRRLTRRAPKRERPTDGATTRRRNLGNLIWYSHLNRCFPRACFVLLP